MTALSTPPPRRRVFWTDARFFIGIALIVVSIAGVWWVVSAARQISPVLQATRTIVPGQTVSADDLRVVDVALGGAADGYLAPHELAEGRVAVRAISAGELVPRSGVGDIHDVAVTTVVVESAVEVPSAVVKGATVELWEAPFLGNDGYDAPRVLVADAVVGAVTRDSSVMGSSGPTLELVIDRTRVADVLSAVAAGSALSVVPQAPPASTGGGSAGGAP